jgi:hypothetical protein
MEQEAQHGDRPDNVVSLDGVLRQRQSTAQVGQPKAEPAGPSDEDEPPPDAA